MPLTTDPVHLHRQILEQMTGRKANKISPLQEDFLFDEFYPNVENGSNSLRPTVLFTSDDCIEYERFLTLVNQSFESVRHETVPHICDTDGEVRDNLNSDVRHPHRRAVCGSSSAIANIDFAFIPPSEELKSMCESSPLVLILLNADAPYVEPTLKRLLGKVKGQSGKVRFILTGDVDNKAHLMRTAWSLSRLLKVPELPIIYFIRDFRVACGESERLLKDILQLPVTFLAEKLTDMLREARLARAHATLLSHMKSCLPTFNRQSKQESLCKNLSSIIVTLSSKTTIPLSEFPAVDFLGEKLMSFDFKRIKKLKDSNLALVNEFIEIDFPFITKMFPCEHDYFFQSPRQSAEIHVEPNVGKYVQDFKSLKPDGGLISGPEVKIHLQQISNLSSSQLYKIWRLSDIDGDGKLSLDEYGICRELIKLAQEGKPIPKSFVV